MPTRLRTLLVVGFGLLMLGGFGCAARMEPPNSSSGDRSSAPEEAPSVYPDDERDRRIEQLNERLDEQTRLLELRQHFLQGLAYESLGEYSRAIDAYRAVRESALQTSGGSVFASRALLRVARIYKNHMDSPSRAEQEYKHFLEQYPDHPGHGKALVELARMYQEEGQFDRAVEAFQSFVRRYPSDDDLQGVYYNLGVIHMKREQPAKAVDAFQKMLSSFPEGDLADGALFRMGQALNQLGETEQQLDAFVRILTDHPESDLREFVMYRTVHLARQLKKETVARRWARSYAEEYPEGRYGSELEKLYPPDDS